jgi:hypothetical protein
VSAGGVWWPFKSNTQRRENLPARTQNGALRSCPEKDRGRRWLGALKAETACESNRLNLMIAPKGNPDPRANYTQHNRPSPHIGSCGLDLASVKTLVGENGYQPPPGQSHERECPCSLPARFSSCSERAARPPLPPSAARTSRLPTTIPRFWSVAGGSHAPRTYFACTWLVPRNLGEPPPGRIWIAGVVRTSNGYQVVHGRWVARNRRGMGINGVDVPGGKCREAAAVGGLFWGKWRTLQWC